MSEDDGNDRVWKKVFADWTQLTDQINRTVSQTNTVFHYCSVATLAAMAEAGGDAPFEQIRTTPLAYLNDISELEHGLNRHLDAAKACLDGSSGEAVIRSCLEKANSRMKEVKFSSLFVACFSAKADSLSLWRGYGDHGRGIALGFDVPHKTQMCSKNNLGLYVSYTPEDTDATVANFTNWVRECLDELKQVEKMPDWFEGLVKEYTELIALKVLCASASIKHESFYEETEYRILHVPATDEVKFRLRQGRLIPYSTISLANHPGLALKKIILGPHCQENQEAIEQLLRAHKYNAVRVEQSNIPLD